MSKLTDDERKILGGLLCELIADIDKVFHDHAPKVAALFQDEDVKGMEKYLRDKFLVRTDVLPDKYAQMYVDSLSVTPPRKTPPPASSHSPE